jgi:hypothetical protein
LAVNVEVMVFPSGWWLKLICVACHAVRGVSSTRFPKTLSNTCDLAHHQLVMSFRRNRSTAIEANSTA